MSHVIFNQVFTILLTIHSAAKIFKTNLDAKFIFIYLFIQFVKGFTWFVYVETVLINNMPTINYNDNY